MAQKKRSFCFTVNNYDDTDIGYLKLLKGVKYMIIGKEVGESGTPHLQGYVMFKNARSVKNIVKTLLGHVEVAKGSPVDNYKYCSKGS